MKRSMPGLFWLAVSTVIYTFLGYPMMVWALSRLRSRPVARSAVEPSVSLIIPAYNEADTILAKIRNSLELDYPAGKLHILVVADGSDDGTERIAAVHEGVSVMFEPERRGKSAAINHAVPFLNDEIVVFTDANTVLESGALRAIVANFADPAVGGVAGEKRVLGGGEGLYWRYESALKRWDSALSSVMGAAGELFAIRRSLFRPIPEGIMFDDFYLSMSLVGAGWRVVYEPKAVALEEPPATFIGDWQRRVRNGAGGIQVITHLTPLLHPRQGLAAWQYLSHRVLRWAVTPLMLPVIFLLNLALAGRPFYKLLLLSQSLFYGLGTWGFLQARRGQRQGLAYVIFYFCYTNLAAILGLWRFLRKREEASWKRTWR